MIIYDYKEDLTLEELNVLAGDGWELVDMEYDPENGNELFILKKGYNDYIKPSDQYTLIQNTETEAEFYLDKTFSYGDAMIITFITIFFFAFLGKIIFNYFFYNE